MCSDNGPEVKCQRWSLAPSNDWDEGSLWREETDQRWPADLRLLPCDPPDELRVMNGSREVYSTMM